MAEDGWFLSNPPALMDVGKSSRRLGTGLQEEVYRKQDLLDQRGGKWSVRGSPKKRLQLIRHETFTV